MEELKKYLTKNNIIIAICVVVFCVCAGFLLDKYVDEQKAQGKFDSLIGANSQAGQTGLMTGDVPETIYTHFGIEDPGLVFDWDYLWEQNEDIYAWIYIPGTNVNYPILQHETDDSYYLEYNLDGSKGYPGCIYTEKINSKEFTDYNTLIYGHNMKNGTMFHDLHNFADKTFFDENRYIVIYLPEETLVYEIYGAYLFSNLHILYNYDCETAEGFASYLEMVETYYANSGNFREGVEVTSEDNIITLSTCTGDDGNRFLVQGVQIEYVLEE